jgi:hypothetical protein
VARARLGELDAQLLQQLGHGVVDVLRAVIGVKAQDDKRKPSSRAASTGIKQASLKRSQVATSSNWVVQSTALM